MFKQFFKSSRAGDVNFKVLRYGHISTTRQRRYLTLTVSGNNFCSKYSAIVCQFIADFAQLICI